MKTWRHKFTKKLRGGKLDSYIVDVHFPDGRRSRVSLGTAKKAEAEAAYALWKKRDWPVLQREWELRKQAEQDAASNPRLDDLHDWFTRTYLADQHLAEKTRAKYRQVLLDFVRWSQAHHVGRVHQLSYAKVLEWLDWSAAARPGAHTQKTRNDHKGILRRMLLAAVKAGLLDKAPITDWQIKKAPPAADTFALTKAELAEVLAIIREEAPQISHIVQYMCYTGCRPSDAVDLRRSQLGQDYVRRRQLKTRQVATYSLCQRAQAVIQHEIARGIDHPDGYVFTTSLGTPYAVNALYKQFSRALSRRGLTVTRDGQSFTVDLKTLRHTYGSHMAHLGCPAFLLQRQMGHTRIETTLQYYHADPAEGLKWAEKFDHDIMPQDSDQPVS